MKETEEILKPEDWFRKQYPFKDHGYWAYIQNNENFVSWNDEIIEEYVSYVLKQSLPSEEENDCDHENTVFKNIRCNCCKDCGDIIEIDI